MLDSGNNRKVGIEWMMKDFINNLSNTEVLIKNKIKSLFQVHNQLL